MNGQNVADSLPFALTDDSKERLAALFDAHYDRLYRLARRLAANTDDALDLVQSTFLKAAKSPKSIPVGAPDEEAWLVRVLINIRRDQWRQKTVRDRHDGIVFGGKRSAGIRDTESSLIAKAAIWQALDVLPPRRRAVLVMYELEGLSVPVIAAVFGISAITVRWHLSKGRRDLASVLR